MQAANSLGSWSVHPDSKFKTFQDIIAAAKAKPGKVSISTSGTGGLWHELAAVVAVSAGVTLKYVPYKGGKNATLAGLNGETMIAGGGTDTVIRTIVKEMAKSTGWKINVINKPGAVGGVATRYVNGKKPDGYTLLGAANYNKYASVMGHTKTRAWRDWQYMQAANSLGSWSVHPDSKLKTFQDIVNAAKAKPGKILSLIHI